MYKQIKEIVNNNIMFKSSKHPGYPLEILSYRFLNPQIYEEKPLAKEIRGIIFNYETGELIARPFHKFFNFGEKLCPVSGTDIAISTEKIDGYLIIGTVYNDNVVLASKGSFTSEQANLAKKIITTEHIKLIKDYCPEYTVMFELVSKQHPIVIEYKVDQLNLIGIRHTKTGKYISPQELIEIAKSYNVPSTTIVHENMQIENIIRDVKHWEYKEGVVCYTDKDLCKIKSQNYLKLHSIVSWIMCGNENQVVKRIRHKLINNELDDIYPYLTPSQKERVDKIVKESLSEIEQTKETIRDIIYKTQGKSRKEIALYMINKVRNKELMSIIFNVKELIEKGTNIDEAINVAVHNHYKKKWTYKQRQI